MRKISEINSNYIGTPEKWSEFLTAWSNLRLQSYNLLVKQEKISWDIKEDLIQQDLTEFQPKSAQEMQKNLARIKLYESQYQKLPKSYRDFLIATNGEVPTWFFYDEFCSNHDERYETKIYSVDQLGDIREREEEFYNWHIRDNLKYYEVSDEEYYGIYQYNPNTRYINSTLGNPFDLAESWHYDRMRYEMNGYVNIDEIHQCALHGYSTSRRIDNTALKIGETSIQEDFIYFLLLPNEVTQDEEWEMYELNASNSIIIRYISFAYLVIHKFMKQVTPYQDESQKFKSHYFEQLGSNSVDLVDLLIKRI